MGNYENICILYSANRMLAWSLKFRPSLSGPGKPSHKMGFRSSVSKSGHPGEGKHEGLVRRNDVLTNGFIGFSLA